MERPGLLAFRCNVCGAGCAFPAAALSREEPSCAGCGSTVRMRAMVHAVSLALFAMPVALPDFPPDPGITGIGLSDWPGYADPMAARIGYRNSWYHIEPRVDITDIPDAMAGTMDFVLSTDVFEHVAPPVSRAFEGARKLLKPDGALVFSVPYVATGVTVEHFPDLHAFTIEQRPEGRVLVNTTAAGERQEFPSLVFHGGEGDTLEMRVFSLPDLLADLARAGFHDVQVLDAPCFEFGIWHDIPLSLPMIARRAPAHARVLAFGPHALVRGAAAPPDAWLRLDREAIAVPYEIWVGGYHVEAVALPGLVEFAIPAALADTAGDHPIVIRTPGSGPAIAAGSLCVV